MKTILAILTLVISLPIQSATFSADRIEEACRSYLLQKYPQDCEVDFSTKFEEVDLSGEGIKAIFDENYNIYNSGVKLDFMADNKLLISKVYNYNIKKEVTIFKSKDYIPSHTNITSAMLVQEKSYVNIDDMDKLVNPIGRVAKKSIYKSESLTSDNTLPDISVKRGEHIVVIASTGTITVRGIGTAMQDGRVGDTIRVKRTDSKKILTGKINESGELILGE